ncbi:WD40-repeat-containing domain protein [Cladorrhinum sp. PSN332]|nr:WD40-repeat-containing domain protein [Cladorrhinum sp. PSN332]
MRTVEIEDYQSSSRPSRLQPNGSLTEHSPQTEVMYHRAVNGGSAPSYYGHDHQEVTRILIQALTDLGYHSAANSVSKESGYEVESPDVASFRDAILSGDWSRAEELLWGGKSTNGKEGQGSGRGLVLAQGADRNAMRFQLRQQKFLELLELRESAEALSVLRTELTPLCRDQHQTLHLLSRLLMCQDADDLKTKANWDGAKGQSRHILLSQLSRKLLQFRTEAADSMADFVGQTEHISPLVMLPEHRLSVLLNNLKRNQIEKCLYHSTTRPISLYSDHLCDRSMFPTDVMVELEQHGGEVYQVAFSHAGDRLAACGTAKGVYIWDTRSFEVIRVLDGHDNNESICNLAWSPDDTMLVTCGRDRYAKLWTTETGHCTKVLEKFDEPVSSCVWAPDGKTFVTGSFDKTKPLCQWDLDGNCLSVWTKQHRTEDLAISPDGHRLVAMDDQNQLHIYNFLTRELEYVYPLDARATSISISHDSRHIFVNKVNHEAHLIDLETREVEQKYQGHKGGAYTIRSDFGGAHENFVISGSEDGGVYIWHKVSATLIHKADAHSPRVNAVAWSPADPALFATCGDDSKIKIWSSKDRVRMWASKSQRSNGAPLRSGNTSSWSLLEGNSRDRGDD